MRVGDRHIRVWVRILTLVPSVSIGLIYSGNNTYYYMECVRFNRDSHPNVEIDADWGLVAQRGLVARENSAFYLISCRLGSGSPTGSGSP